MMLGTIWLAIGLCAGFGLAFLARRYILGSRQRRAAATPVTYASRQELRKAQRQERKKGL
jgi:hypothetical protein